jgi:hypothetical protein
MTPQIENENRAPSTEPPQDPSGPSPHEIYVEMDAYEPYRVNEFVDKFNTNRWTIKRRLERLTEMGFINKKSHCENSTTYWRPETAQEKSEEA